jgi:FMN phosphatase YigB (HAD superfamily)
MKKVHSYDVFDTCLVRTYAFPSDLFLDIAYELRAILEPVLGEDFAEIFRDTRVAAEARVIKASVYEEITLEEIWAEISKMLPELDSLIGIKKEIELELKCLRPNPLVLSQVFSSRSQQARIIFISDSYLPAEILRQALVLHGFMIDGDGLYVSSECRFTKRSANLFKYVLNKESISADDILHYGDNATSDVIIPLQCGMVAQRHVDTALNTFEKALLAVGSDDQLIKSRLVAGMRIFRLGKPDQAIMSEQSFVASFLGPFLFVFASWVLSKAQQDGVKRLYFLSRDCYALWRVASALSDQFSGIECRYLHVSRQALFLASASDLSPSGMPWMRRSFENQTLENLLAKVELDITTAGPEFVTWAAAEGESKKIVTESDWDTFWSLLNREPVREKLKLLIETRKAAALQYFDDQGLLDESEKGIVDLGWWLTCQNALRTVLKSKKETINLRGYYLGLYTNRLSVSEVGRASALFYSCPPDRMAQLDAPHVFRRVTALEHVVGCAPHGTVHHYQYFGKNAEPVCAGIDNEQAQRADHLVLLVQKFACQNVKLVRSFTTDTVYRDILDRLISSCFSFPNPLWGQTLSKIRVSIDQNNKDDVNLAAALQWTDIFNRFIPKLYRRYNRMRPWPEVDLCMSTDNVKYAIKLRTLLVATLHFIRK